MNRRPSTLASNLRWLLDNAATPMTEMDLSEATGVPQPTINRILGGKSAEPRDSTLHPIAEYFHLTLDQIRYGNVQAIRNGTATKKDIPARSAGLVTNQLENDIDALRLAVAGLYSVIADERPAEGARLAARLRKTAPPQFLSKGYLHGLLTVLDKASASAGARRGGRSNANPES